MIKNSKALFFQQVVKTCLCLQNGNAAVKRSLSYNKNTVTERNLLSGDAIMNLRRMKDYSRSCGGTRKVNTSRKEVITKMRDMHAVHALPESKRKRLKQGSFDSKKLKLQKKKKKTRNCIRK